MSKFTIKVKLQGLEIEVEGTREDAPKIYQQIGKQVSGLLQSPAVLASGNGSSVLEGEVIDDGAGKKTKKPRKTNSGTRTPADDLSLPHDPEKYGTPQQAWTTAQKSIWFLYVVAKQTSVAQLTAYSIAKNFNRYFKAPGQLNGGNLMKGMKKERLKTTATANPDITPGTPKNV